MKSFFSKRGLSSLKFRGGRGYTLMEVVIVIVILGIVSSLAVVQFMKGSERVELESARIAISEVEMAERSYAAKFGSFTTDVSQLRLDRAGAVVGASGGKLSVSISVDKDGNLWLALAHNEGCLARRIPDPLSGVEATDVSVTGACDADSIANEAATD